MSSAVRTVMWRCSVVLTDDRIGSRKGSLSDFFKASTQELRDFRIHPFSRFAIKFVGRKSSLCPRDRIHAYFFPDCCLTTRAMPLVDRRARIEYRLSGGFVRFLQTLKVTCTTRPSLLENARLFELLCSLAVLYAARCPSHPFLRGPRGSTTC